MASAPPPTAQADTPQKRPPLQQMRLLWMQEYQSETLASMTPRALTKALEAFEETFENRVAELMLPLMRQAQQQIRGVEDFWTRAQAMEAAGAQAREMTMAEFFETPPAEEASTDEVPTPAASSSAQDVLTPTRPPPSLPATAPTETPSARRRNKATALPSSEAIQSDAAALSALCKAKVALLPARMLPPDLPDNPALVLMMQAFDRQRDRSTRSRVLDENLHSMRETPETRYLSILTMPGQAETMIPFLSAADWAEMTPEELGEMLLDAMATALLEQGAADGAL